MPPRTRRSPRTDRGPVRHSMRFLHPMTRVLAPIPDDGSKVFAYNEAVDRGLVPRSIPVEALARGLRHRAAEPCPGAMRELLDYRSAPVRQRAGARTSDCRIDDQ